MLSFPVRIHATHMNALFPAYPFPMPPNFAVTPISGWHLLFPHGLAERRFSGEGACKSHPPFNLHTFRPCQPSPVSPFWLPCTPCQQGLELFCQIAPNRAERVPGGQFIHFFRTRPQIATRTATGGNKAFRLPIRTHQFHSSQGLEEYCHIYRNRKKAPIFRQNALSLFQSLPALLSHSIQTSVCSAIPACFRLTFLYLLLQTFVFF